MNRKYLICVIVVLLVGQGCKKFLEIAPPKDQLATGNVFLLNETAIASMTSIYSAMINGPTSPSRLALFAGISSDEFTNNNTGQLFVLMYRNNNLTKGDITAGYWTKAYNLIYQSNAVYEGCEKSQSLNPDVKKQLMAEARFVRAYCFFYLVNLYGNVPLASNTDYTINRTLPRGDVGTVYNQIIADLQYAKENLNAGYVKPNSIATGDDRIRPNKASASALLARVFLYTKQYPQAETEATTIIVQNSTYTLPGLEDAFVKSSKEIIWALTPTTPNTINTPEGFDFIILSKPSISAQPTITDQLLNAYDTSDHRKIKWIGKFTDVSATPNVEHYFPNKYKISTGVTIAEYSIIFRLGEQYLIRSEARARQNNLNGAIADLDVVRQRAHSPFLNTNPATAKDALIPLILQERRLELFSEQGHRWLDLKRTGTIDAVMSEQATIKNSTWNSPKQLWPIPQSEILANPNITQNESYD
jgi:starch-binding outer membrane protein, SusD/RagB family